MNTNEELQALYDLTDSGTHEAWPEQVRYEREWYNEDCGPYSVWLYGDSIGGFELDDQHALDLVRASVERWLAGKDADDEASCPKYLDITALHELAKSSPGGVGEGREIFKVGNTVQYSRDEYDVQFNALPEALRRAVERE